MKFEVFYDISFEQELYEEDSVKSEEAVSEEEVVDSEILQNLTLNLPDVREALNFGWVIRLTYLGDSQ